MALRNIRLNDDEILRKKSRKVKKIDEKILTLLDDMADTLHSVDGLGLAAPQVGVLKKIAIIEIEEGEILELINPVILDMQGEQVFNEACLSIPGKSGKVIRPETVKVEALNRFNEKIEFEGSGMLAAAICHETDHLEGVLYIDKIIEEAEETEKAEG